MPSFDVVAFKKDVLERHNKLREEHGAPPLEEDNLLNNLAEEMSFQISESGVAATNKTLKTIGQLVISLEGQEPSCDSLFKNVIETAEKYDYNEEKYTDDQKYFAQTVWVDSKKFGCGLTTNKDGAHFIVFMYKPPGNVLGQYKLNVFPKGTPVMKRNLNTPVRLDDVPDSKELAERMVKFHNSARDCHDAQNVEWDEEIASEAKEHAHVLLKENLEKKEFSNPPKKYGRNVFIVKGLIPSIGTCCKRWYSGSSQYNYESNTFQADSSSFSQLVWYDTNRIGASYANEGDNCVVVVLYSPRGNTLNGFARNVSKPNGKSLSFEES